MGENVKRESSLLRVMESLIFCVREVCVCVIKIKKKEWEKERALATQKKWPKKA